MKKTMYILLCFILVLFITGCNKEEKSNTTNTTNTTKEALIQDLEVVEEKDSRVVEGILEGYHFVETEEKTNRVKIEMEDGSIILIVLSNSSTPITIENFKNLVDEKFYDGLIFHRVIEGFMIQGGDPTGTGAGGSSEEIKGEFSDNGVTNNLSHTRGVVSMARSEELNSASSQFFIVHQDSTYLDGLYASFGKVFAGMDAVDAIATTETDASNDRPLVEQKIKTIRFINIIK